MNPFEATYHASLIKSALTLKYFYDLRPNKFSRMSRNLNMKLKAPELVLLSH
jgi:hypothetical protein